MNLFENPRQKFLTKTFGLLAIEHLAYIIIMIISLHVASTAFQFKILTNILLFECAWLGIAYFTQVGALKLNIFGYLGASLNMIIGGIFYAELSTYIPTKYLIMFLTILAITFTLTTIIGAITPFDIGTTKSTIDTNCLLACLLTGYLYLSYSNFYLALGIAIVISTLISILTILHLPYINHLENVQYPDKANALVINATMVYTLTPYKIIMWLWHRFCSLFEYKDDNPNNRNITRY